MIDTYIGLYPNHPITFWMLSIAIILIFIGIGVIFGLEIESINKNTKVNNEPLGFDNGMLYGLIIGFLIGMLIVSAFI